MSRVLSRSGNSRFMEHDAMDPLVNMKSPEYENYYDSKFHIFEELKMEVPVTEDNEISNFNDHNVIKHEAMENRLPLNVTIKTERIEEGEILDNNKDMTVPCKLTVQEVQINSNERILKNNVNLLKHNNEQTNMARVVELNELHKCKHCDKSFDHHDDMLSHISLVHNEKKFKCELCGKELNKLSNLKRHITLFHKHKEPPKDAEIIFKCIHCNTAFNNRNNLNDHAMLCQKEEEIIAYKCDSCHGVYKSKQNLRKHVKRMHFDYGRTFNCSCGKQYRSPLQLSSHRIQCNMNTNKEEHKCKCCSAVFIMKVALTNHMKNIHYDYGRTFDCSCGKQFRSPEYLRHHKRRQHERKIKDKHNDSFQCNSCQNKFKSKYYLVKHIKKIHYDYGRTFDCWCGKQFRSPEYLGQHKRRQHERKIKNTDNDRFQCDSCQKIFKKKYNLIIHIKKIHYDYGRTFDCWCGKQFRAPVYLREHKRRHERTIQDTDNDSFQCDRCQNKFKSKYYLVKHIKMMHYDYGRTFDCWCGKQFRSPEYLGQHKRRQHERKIKNTDNDRFQ